MQPTLGFAFTPWFTPEQLLPLARVADEAGLDELWLWEDCFAEAGMATAGAALGATERLRVAVGLFPTPLRNVALTAMELAGLARMFPGRFTGGVGHGVQAWMEQAGARVESPVALLREYLAALRALLAGETVSTEGRYVRLRDVALAWPPPGGLPVYAGAAGPRSIAVCGELADGLLLTGGLTPDAARAALDTALRARTAPGPLPMMASVITAIGPGAQERVERDCRAWGHPAAPDVCVTGDAATIAATFRRFAAAGATTVVAQPTRDEPDPAGLVRFLAEQVRPLLLTDT